MCGLTGFWQQGGCSHDEAVAIVQRMTDTLVHRGPDDAGEWIDEVAGIALGHRRLSILDLSPAGHQPMLSASGRYVMAYNGEVYNHLELRQDLATQGAAPAWRGHSDTETLLAAVDAWGIEETLQRCVGMFAIALWDRQERLLTLARDRLGEKPLYYGWVSQPAGSAFVFASELKAIRAYPGFRATVCRAALGQYLRFTYVPAPYSIYEGIFKLEPGCLLQVQMSPPATPPRQPLRPADTYGSVSLKRWWSLREVVAAGVTDQISNEAEAIWLVEKALSTAIRQQLLADVPLGAFLSGGVDSSTVVALMQQHSSHPVKTFTIGFEERGFDEAPYAQAVARHLGTDHYEMRVDARMAQEVIPTLPHIYDEPFADSSQIPTHLVCRAARQQVTVALSGDAGDELFGGYNRYFWGPRIWHRLSWLPKPLRRQLGQFMIQIPIAQWDRLGSVLGVGRGIEGVVRLGDKLHKLGLRLQTVHHIDDLYRSLVSEWPSPEPVVLDAKEAQPKGLVSLLDDPLPAAGTAREQLRMMYWDALTYLPDDILCKVDRAAMACSLETRVPFLDHRLVALAWRLPLSMKIRGNVGKWVLRQVLYKYVPPALIERPKAGFGIPIGQWLCGSLRPWAEDLLAEERLRQEGYLDPAPIRQVWSEHLGGHRDHTAKLWSVLMFQAWLQEHAGVTS